MDLYYHGWLLAVLIGIAKLMITSSISFSTAARNMGKIQQYYNPWLGIYSSNKVTPLKWTLYTAYLIGIAPLASWLTVLSAVWTWVYALVNKPPTPDKLKEIQFTMNSVDLSEDDVRDLLIQTMSLMSNGELSVSVEIERDQYSRREMTINPIKRTIIFEGGPLDDLRRVNDIGEYNIENDKVMVRITNRYSERRGQREYWIKDGVVLEDEMRGVLSRTSSDSTVSEYVEVAKAKTNWWQLEERKGRYFILSAHPKLFPKSEIRRLAQTELEVLNKGYNRFVTEARAAGLVLTDADGETQFRYPDSWTEEQRRNCDPLFESANLHRLGLQREDVIRHNREAKVLEDVLKD
jgi:hypothetical protein